MSYHPATRRSSSTKTAWMRSTGPAWKFSCGGCQSPSHDPRDRL
jgi:hypothetical protein